MIFISIDENEVFNLRSLCNEVFGEDNFLTELVIKVRHENRILKADKDFHETYECCLAYRKSTSYKQYKRIEENTSIDKYIYSIEIIGEPSEQLICDGKTVEVFSKENYKLIKNDSPSTDYFQSISIRGSLKEGNSSGRFFMKHFDKIKDKFGYLYKVPSMGNDKYDFRYFMRQPTEKHANGIYFQGVPLDKKDTKEVPFPNFYDFVNEFNNVGYEGGIEFRSGKKPLEFLRKVLTLGGVYEDKEAIILDFFCGSASSAEASIRTNLFDGGNRRFIMIQLPEDLDNSFENSTGTTKSIIAKTIGVLDKIGKPHVLTEIGKERIRRAGTKIKEESATTAPNLDIGFRVLKVDSSNMANIYYTPDETKQTELFKITDNIKDDRTPEDLLFQVLLDWGVDLTLPITKENIADLDVFFVDENALAACFVKNSQITEDFCKELAKREPLRVVFRDSGFGDDGVKINVEQIFKLMSPHTDVKTI